MGMYLVVELRRGDIVQTWAATLTHEGAYSRLAAIQAHVMNDTRSWWKIVYVPNPLGIHLVEGNHYYIAVSVDWEEDNDFAFVGMFDQLELAPPNIRDNADIWVDQVCLTH
jgi:hypothetical protein